MSIIDRILGQQSDETEQTPREHSERVEGKIIKLDDGWGFISSKAIPYTRIFFHWSALNQDSLHFSKLRKGMRVDFEPMDVPGKGLRAIKINAYEDEANED